MIPDGFVAAYTHRDGEFTRQAVRFNIADIIYIQYTYGKESAAQCRKDMKPGDSLCKKIVGP